MPFHPPPSSRPAGADPQPPRTASPRHQFMRCRPALPMRDALMEAEVQVAQLAGWGSPSRPAMNSGIITVLIVKSDLR